MVQKISVECTGYDWDEAFSITERIRAGSINSSKKSDRKPVTDIKNQKGKTINVCKISGRKKQRLPMGIDNRLTALKPIGEESPKNYPQSQMPTGQMNLVHNAIFEKISYQTREYFDCWKRTGHLDGDKLNTETWIQRIH